MDSLKQKTSILYKQLLNPVYLWKLQNPDSQIILSSLAQELGITRQTVAKLAKEAETQEVLDIENFHNEIQNKYERAIAIYKDLTKKPYYTSQDIAKSLEVSYATIEKYFIGDQSFKENRESQFKYVVYSIKDLVNNRIIYIGSTESFVSRRWQHISSVRNKSGGIGLYCNQHGLTWDDLEMAVLFDEFENKVKMLQMEKQLIEGFQPEANIIKY